MLCAAQLATPPNKGCDKLQIGRAEYMASANIAFMAHVACAGSTACCLCSVQVTLCRLLMFMCCLDRRSFYAWEAAIMTTACDFVNTAYEYTQAIDLLAAMLILPTVHIWKTLSACVRGTHLTLRRSNPFASDWDMLSATT